MQHRKTASPVNLISQIKLPGLKYYTLSKPFQVGFSGRQNKQTHDEHAGHSPVSSCVCFSLCRKETPLLPAVVFALLFQLPFSFHP